MRMAKFLGLLAVLILLPAASFATNPEPTAPTTPSLGPASPDAVVLCDHMSGAGTNGTSSQNFEAAFDAFDDFLGDDCTVPAGESWSVNLVEIDGVYFNGPGPAASVNVWFYPDANCRPGPVAEATYLAQPYAGVGGDFQIALSPAASLASGNHWLVVQANQNFNPAGQWGWNDRITVDGCPAAWQNPGGGFGTPCNAWGARGATCGIDPSAPDQLFRLSGDRGQTTAVEPSTWGKIKAIYQD